MSIRFFGDILGKLDIPEERAQKSETQRYFSQKHKGNMNTCNAIRCCHGGNIKQSCYLRVQ